jgi:hypothetical protein
VTAARKSFPERVLSAGPWLLTALVGLTVLTLIVPALLIRFGFRAKANEAYPVDTVVDLMPSVYEGSTYTLIVFARSNCAVCQRASPLISELVTISKMSPNFGRRLIVVRQVDQEERNYAASLGFDTNGELVERGAEPLRARTVPIVLVVTRAGRVLFSSQGEPRPERYQDAAALIRRLTAEQAK